MVIRGFLQEEGMKRLVVSLAAALIAVSVFGQAKLPDLKGRTIRAVTENAFTPLNFVDPKTGKAVGWEYDAVNEIGKEAEREDRVEHHLVGHDDPGRPRRPVRRGHGRDLHHRRQEEAGRLLGSVHGEPAVHARPQGRERASRTRRSSAPTRSSSSARRPAQRTSTSRSTTSWTGRKTTRGSSSSRPSAPRCRPSSPGTWTACSWTPRRAGATSAPTPTS